MLLRRIPRWLWLAAPLAYFLYIFRLGGVGILGPDEPRYAAIGREMARSGDWITPRLWGQPWFEKPALTYWMTAAGFRLGLGPELAPRLPVALLAVAFLVFFYWMVKREFGGFTGAAATLILATSAAWIGFSQVGVTDLPLTVFFSAAMLGVMPWIGKRDGRRLPLAAASLGAAVLAKGLLPLVLAAPIASRARWVRDLLRWRVLLPFCAVAVPWYALCYGRNGGAFLHEFFVVHHFQRFTETGLQHVRPWWFYLPLLPALLLPWAPLLIAAGRAGNWREPRRLFLLLWAGFGLIFFSASRNKLPGYLLPLLPALAVLMALGLERGAEADARPDFNRRLLVLSALLLAVYPMAGPLLPAAVANLWTAAPPVVFRWTWLLPLVPAAGVWLLDRRGFRLAAVATIAAAAAIAAGSLKVRYGPEVDRLGTVRPLSREVALHSGQVCAQDIRREWQYGLAYYSGIPLPDCKAVPMPFHVIEKTGRQPDLMHDGNSTTDHKAVDRR